jgi:hypothetical protein
MLGLSCSSVPVTGSLQVAGTWTGNSDGTYSDNTTTSGDEQITLPASCLTLSGTTTTCDAIGGPLQALGFASVDCTAAMGGGCTCSAKIQQTGGLGLASTDAHASGTYKVSSNVVTADDMTKYAYCVSGNQMTWTPQSAGATTTGTIAFQNAGASGAGGSTGAGGGSGMSGASATGGAAGTNGSGGLTGAGGSIVTGDGPCDVYATGSTPCAAAFSTVRPLSSKYKGPLYQVRKGGTKTGTGGTTLDIGVASGFADAAAQDTFCGADTCTFSKLYDQSGKGNDLVVALKGCYMGTASDDDYESSATKRSLMVGGHKVYALYMNPHEGYRNNGTSGMPTGSASQGIYEVADGKRIGPACCWDFGNARKTNCYGGTGTMNSLYFGTGFWGKGTGNGPWWLVDFEAGVWAGGTGASNVVNMNLPSSNVDYAFGVLKTSATNYAIRVGNAQSGDLTTAYDGNLPASLKWGLEGAIILGIGGDNSNSSQGTFFEGAITAGRPTDTTDTAVLKNVQSAGYGR